MKIKVTFFGILMLASLIATKSYLSLVALLAALLHEIGHLCVARACNVPIKELRFDIFGASITPKESFSSYKKEIAVALGGPLVNIVCFVILLPFLKAQSEILNLFLATSAFLGLLNLLPIEGFDGGRVIYCTVALVSTAESADKAISFLSVLCLFSLWMLSVYLMIRTGGSISMFVFSFALLCKIFVNQKNKIE